MENGNVMYLRNKLVVEEDFTSNGVWDDTALVKAYDLAICAAKQQVAHQVGKNGYGFGNERPRPSSEKAPKDGHLKTKYEAQPPQVGSYCRSVYSEDGKIYEAVVKSIQPNGKCIVKYIGYGNEEEIAVKELMASKGPAARKQQEEQASYDAAYAEEEGNGFEEVQQKETPAPKIETKPPSKKTAGAGSKGRPQEPQFGSQFPPVPDIGLPHPPVFPPYVMPIPPPKTLFENVKSEDEALTSMLLSWYMSGFHTGYYHGLQECKSQITQRSDTPQ